MFTAGRGGLAHGEREQGDQGPVGSGEGAVARAHRAGPRGLLHLVQHVELGVLVEVDAVPVVEPQQLPRQEVAQGGEGPGLEDGVRVVAIQVLHRVAVGLGAQALQQGGDLVVARDGHGMVIRRSLLTGRESQRVAQVEQAHRNVPAERRRERFAVYCPGVPHVARSPLALPALEWLQALDVELSPDERDPSLVVDDPDALADLKL